MTWSTLRPLRTRSHRLLPGHALIRVRRDALPISTASAERRTRRATWLLGRASRTYRTKITRRFAVALAVATMILGFLLAMQSLNPLERAQSTQTAREAAVSESMQWAVPEGTAHSWLGSTAERVRKAL